MQKWGDTGEEGSDLTTHTHSNMRAYGFFEHSGGIGGMRWSVQCGWMDGMGTASFGLWLVIRVVLSGEKNGGTSRTIDEYGLLLQRDCFSLSLLLLSA